LFWAKYDADYFLAVLTASQFPVPDCVIVSAKQESKKSGNDLPTLYFADRPSGRYDHAFRASGEHGIGTWSFWAKDRCGWQL
jgi:hypothetical protein